jgi:DNA polymerase I-like protein with 3'-5' exonuclease and polymerase domains
LTYLTWDIETSTHTSFKRKANPFDGRNSIVMQGYKRKGGQPVAEYYGRNKLPFDWFTRLLEGTRILVGMNIKFDLLYALREPQNLEAWMDWIANGGQIWDIQLAEYLLTGMFPEEQLLPLDVIAPRYGGNVKFDEVKALWQAGVATEDIPEDLLTRYLIGDGIEQGDIGNTELAFLGQLETARKRGQVKSILLNMGSLVATIEMERNGMKVDTARAEILRAALHEKLIEVKAGLNAFLPADLPFEFNWTNRYHLSPLIFGGQVKYEIKDYILDEQGNRTYPQKKETHYVLANGEDTIPVEKYMAMVNSATPDPDAPELLFNKSGKNAGEPKTKQVTVPDTDRPKMKIFERVYIFPQMTAPKKQWASSTPGLYSVAAEVIEELGGRGIPFLDTLVQVAKWSKDMTTYYWAEDEKGQRKGMLTLVQDGIIHHSINHVKTVTGRFSSSDPNLQNLPRGGGKETDSQVKTIFVSRFPDGVIVQSDFTSLEVYVQAILTGCKQLILDLQAGLDMHCVRVAAKEKITYEEALLRCKGTKEVKPVEGWPEKRTDAKVFSFQRAYGAGADKISTSTGIPLEDVKALIQAESERYPEIDAYYLRKTEQIEAARYPTSKFLRHPDNPQITCQLGRALFTEPDGKVYGYQESPTPEFILKRFGKTQGFSPTEIRNYGVQGGGGEWAKAAMWLAVREYYRRRNFDHKALLVNQVHDALYGDNDKSVTFEASALLHACMEGASDFMEWYFGWNVPVPVPSVTEQGPSMGESDEINLPGWSELAARYRVELRARYMNNYQPSFVKE